MVLENLKLPTDKLNKRVVTQGRSPPVRPHQANGSLLRILILQRRW
jgi:hypothetical protein